jgi:hypothetical protein
MLNYETWAGKRKKKKKLTQQKPSRDPYMQIQYVKEIILNVLIAAFIMFWLVTHYYKPVVLMRIKFCVQSFPHELPIFLREYGSGIYRSDVYFIAKNLAEVCMPYS